ADLANGLRQVVPVRLLLAGGPRDAIEAVVHGPPHHALEREHGPLVGVLERHVWHAGSRTFDSRGTTEDAVVARLDFSLNRELLEVFQFAERTAVHLARD